MSEKKHNSHRPLSPHLSIYRLPLSALLSITHRITGFALFIGALLLAWWVVLNAYGCGDCINSFLRTIPVRTFLVLWTLALYYHMLNGIRHLYWDMAKGLSIKSVNLSGILVVIFSVVLTLASWLSVFYIF